uniref:Lipocalin/cytosolic fatty-acid binding domain-containing protein n=1 Tax=Moschus moschiferus TaxID=68415 RepID=A0A8C6E5X5_MOSMO
FTEIPESLPFLHLTFHKILTHYIAASNKEKITENGPFHIYFRYIEFDEGDGTVDAEFYLKKGSMYVSFLSHTDAGQNEVQILHVSKSSIIGHVKNVDEDGNETDVVGIINDKLSDSDFERFKEETKQKGIPEENIVNFIDNDDCPEE